METLVYGGLMWKEINLEDMQNSNKAQRCGESEPIKDVLNKLKKKM